MAAPASQPVDDDLAPQSDDDQAAPPLSPALSRAIERFWLKTTRAYTKRKSSTPPPDDSDA
jgi:hypothetical protein